MAQQYYPLVIPARLESSFDVSYDDDGEFQVRASHEFDYDAGVDEQVTDLSMGELHDRDLEPVLSGGQTVRVVRTYTYRTTDRDGIDGRLSVYEGHPRGDTVRTDLFDGETVRIVDGVAQPADYRDPQLDVVGHTPMQIATKHHFGGFESGLFPYEQVMAHMVEEYGDDETMFLDVALEETEDSVTLDHNTSEPTQA